MQLGIEQTQTLENLLTEFELELILAFGSKIKGDEHDKSDLDIAIIGVKGDSKESELFLELYARLQKIFPGEQIDLALLNHPNPLFLNQVMQSAQLLAGTVQRFEQQKINAFKYYQDFKPYLQLERDYITKYISSRRGVA